MYTSYHSLVFTVYSSPTVLGFSETCIKTAMLGPIHSGLYREVVFEYRSK